MYVRTYEHVYIRMNNRLSSILAWVPMQSPTGVYIRMYVHTYMYNGQVYNRLVEYTHTDMMYLHKLLHVYTHPVQIGTTHIYLHKS